MILYVNGDSHTAAGEAVNDYCFAEDDPLYWALGRQPHPDNLRVSWGCELANMLGAILHCDAESASSDDRIIRTTREYLKENTPDLVVIGWSSWEREEWLIDGTYYQVNASGIDVVPVEYQNKYKQWVSEINWQQACSVAQQRIFQFHQELKNQNIKHLFFSTNWGAFNLRYCPKLIWGNNFFYPYNSDYTYLNWAKLQGFTPRKTGSYHFGPDAHAAWAELLYQNITKKVLTA